MGKRAKRHARVGRTPMWPDYFPKEYPYRAFALVKGDTLYVETGECLKADTFAAFVTVLFDETLMGIVESLSGADFLWLSQSVRDNNATVLSTEDGTPIAVRFERNKSSRWVVQSSTWDRHADAALLSDLQALRDVCGLAKPTPGSWGTSLLRKSWALHHFQRYSAPNAIALEFLRKNSIGGRCDTLVSKGAFFPELIELDGALFYIAHFLELPVGTSKLFLRDRCSEFATYFARCNVTIRKELPLGPFPVKRSKGKISYPTLPGRYATHLWKEEIDKARAMGCDVTIQGGVGWLDLAHCTLPFCQDIFALRQAAPTEAIATLIKKIAVATIGHFGMDNTFYTLVPLEGANEQEPCVLDEHFDPINYCVREEKNYKAPAMLHWYNYTIRMAALTLFDFALSYAIEGRLIMTNYDAIIVLERDERHMYAEKHSAEAKLVELGHWRYQLLTNVTIHGDRSLTCDQKDTRPGIPLQGR